MSFNAIRENKILAKIYETTVSGDFWLTFWARSWKFYSKQDVTVERSKWLFCYFRSSNGYFVTLDLVRILNYDFITPNITKSWCISFTKQNLSR